MKVISLFPALILCLPWHAQAKETVFESGINQTVMIELYTSEGCSSCPPAEKYLNSLKSNQQLWKKYIPLAFHVDYWDYLGWKDKFASPLHTKRQEQHAKANGAQTIYTPGFFVNGRTWRKGFLNSLPDTSQPGIGNLRVTYNNSEIYASFKPLIKVSGELELNVAILGMGLTTDIGAGENSGRVARHDFVVLAHKTVKGKNHIWRDSLPAQTGIQASTYALVAWLGKRGDPTPLQATGGLIQPGNEK